MKLRTRKPTGAVAWPILVVEGAEKVGKTYAAFQLSASEQVGRTFVFDMGEGSGDEYASLGPYELVEHNGTFTDFAAQLELACQVQDDAGPTVVVIDSASMVWQLLKDWGETRARRTKKNAAALRKDPDAEISIPMNIWTDIADRWGHMIHTLRTNSVIGILICRGREVAKVGPDGQPVSGETDYKIDAHKSTLFAATAQVRVEAPGKTRLMSARSLHATIPTAGMPLPAEMPLEHVIFDVLGAGGTFAVSSAIEPEPNEPEMNVAGAKTRLLNILTRGRTDNPKQHAVQIWAAVAGHLEGGDTPVPADVWEQVAKAAADLITNQETDQ